MQDRMWGLKASQNWSINYIFGTFFENEKNKEFWDEDKW